MDAPFIATNDDFRVVSFATNAGTSAPGLDDRRSAETLEQLKGLREQAAVIRRRAMYADATHYYSELDSKEGAAWRHYFGADKIFAELAPPQEAVKLLDLANERECFKEYLILGRDDVRQYLVVGILHDAYGWPRHFLVVAWLPQDASLPTREELMDTYEAHVAEKARKSDERKAKEAAADATFHAQRQSAKRFAGWTTVVASVILVILSILTFIFVGWEWGLGLSVTSVAAVSYIGTNEGIYTKKDAWRKVFTPFAVVIAVAGIALTLLTLQTGERTETLTLCAPPVSADSTSDYASPSGKHYKLSPKVLDKMQSEMGAGITADGLLPVPADYLKVKVRLKGGRFFGEPTVTKAHYLGDGSEECMNE